MPLTPERLFENLSKFYDADHEVVYRLKCYDYDGSDPLVVNPLKDPKQGPGLWPMVDGVKMLFGYTYDVDPWEDGSRVDWCAEVPMPCGVVRVCWFGSSEGAATWICSHLESFDAVEDTDLGPICGHSSCGQHYIDTGDVSCIQLEDTDNE